MPENQWRQVKELFHEALRRDASERDAFLESACGGDDELRIEVESLLIALSDATTFLEEPLVVEPPPTPAWRLAEGQTISHYTVLSPIGIGGMGEVYLARDNQLHRSVALKILPADLANDAARLRRFQNEAMAVSALNHPNILTIFEFGEVGGVHIFASEFVKGETLRQRLTRERRLAVPDAVDIAVQIASALRAAHEAGVIHRDIKPENVMIRDDGYVKVLDFGLAKFSAAAATDSEGETRPQNLSHPGMIMGTASYMSPEQARGRPIDARTDLFSFGVLLYEMFGGTVPFRGLTKTDVLAAIIQHDPPPVSAHNRRVPPTIDRIVEKCLEKDRDDRYASAAELFADLKAALVPTAAEPAEPEEVTETIEAPAAAEPRRSRRWWYAAGAALLFLAVSFAAVPYIARRLGIAADNEPKIRSLAVLPLKSLDSGENYLGLGIADAVIRSISQTGELTVRPTSAVRRYLTEDVDAITAARELGTDAVLEGSIQQSEGRLRVGINLLRASDGKSIWSDNFDMRASDAFAIQDAVATQVAEHMKIRLVPAHTAQAGKTPNSLAYDYYLKGVNSLDQRGFDIESKAQNEATIALFKRSIEADPNFALAHAQLAYAYGWMGIHIDVDAQAEWVARAKDEIARADALDPQLAETHIARHQILISANEGFQMEAGIRELLEAMRLNPNVGNLDLAVDLNHLGLEDLSDHYVQRALEIDPTSEFIKNIFGFQYMYARRYDAWLAFRQKYFDGKPNAPYLLGTGRLDEAEAQFEQWKATEHDVVGIRAFKAILSALKGDHARAEAEVPALVKELSFNNRDYHHQTYDIACIYAISGKSTEAVKWLRETAATGFPDYPMFERDHYLDRIRQTPEFARFMAESKAQFETNKRAFGGG